MSQDQQQLALSPPDLDRNKVFKLLGKLSISLGCNHPNLDHIMQVFKPHKPRPDIELMDIQKHFKFLENNAKDLQLQALQQLRSKLFLYLHGMLLKLEPDDQKRRIYLILCYKLFDANSPKIMSLSAILAYREEYIDRLITLVQKIIRINEVELVSARLASKINVLCQLQFDCQLPENIPTIISCVQLERRVEEEQPKAIKCFPIQLKVKAFAYLQHFSKPFSRAQFKGCKRQLGRLELTVLDDIELVRADRVMDCNYLDNWQFHVGDYADLFSVADRELPTDLSFLHRLYQDDDTQSLLSEQPLRLTAGQCTSDEALALPSLSPPTERWQHERFLIGAPRTIINSFRCNPSYQFSNDDPSRPTFFEQLTQFMEMVSTKDCALNAVELKARIRKTMRQAISNHRLSLRVMARMGLSQLLTEAERREYEALRWQHRDCGEWIELGLEDRERDALTAMLGVACMQLKSSAAKSRLMLRSPHHQHTISESFLLLSIGHVGSVFKRMQQLETQLSELDECGGVLAHCLHDELQVLHTYHQQQQLKPESMLRMFWFTRRHLVRFQWFGEVCKALTYSKASLLTSLHLQLGLNGEFDELLQLWLLKATQPLLNRIVKWLLRGELHKVYFIQAHREYANGPLYWRCYFELIDELLPPFLNPELAQLLLGVGRSQRYAWKLLNVTLKCSISADQLHSQLSEACGECYEQQNEEPLREILLTLQQETSKALLLKLNELQPSPLELFCKLHEYLLLTDANFVRNLIELLEPVLEHTVDCYNGQQLNNLLKQLLGKHNEQLFVDQLAGEGKHNWCRFLLRWKLPTHWSALIGDRLEQYASCFTTLWQLHRADYVLNERIRHQQAYFLDNTGLGPTEDILRVTERFIHFIDKLLGVMYTLRDYFLNEVLGNTFKRTYEACKIASTLDTFLALHADYLNTIEYGVFRTASGRKSRLLLAELYAIILQVDVEQRRFLSLCRLVATSINTDSLRAFHWSCLSTCDMICDLEKKFQQTLANLLLALYSAGSQPFVSLAKNLNRNHYHGNKCEQLKLVNTFRFMRKFPR
ncbi:hypothetical protein KR093_005450 [Drosophila rubida]|uniref:Gamma-tubulin complex component n=1 Tax=Drosophila rubida TaxID=30044 RepID=A0AAD4K4J3_9MUSC|nr:hypothetical protein KR093_005450 [Drosophila rubida]